mmetsp:Transcript_87800/g.253190  ORF Transcript_87800/g.253190 Transcript_87800/m.253190 type:complete len:253 (-) Transcript_87800:143-901(-)
MSGQFFALPAGLVLTMVSSSPILLPMAMMVCSQMYSAISSLIFEPLARSGSLSPRFREPAFSQALLWFSMSAFHAFKPLWPLIDCSTFGRSCTAILLAAWPMRCSLMAPPGWRHNSRAPGTSHATMCAMRTSEITSFFSMITSVAIFENGASTLPTAASKPSAIVPSSAEAPWPAMLATAEKPACTAPKTPPEALVSCPAFLASLAAFRSSAAAILTLSKSEGAEMDTFSGLASAGSMHNSIISFDMCLQIT